MTEIAAAFTRLSVQPGQTRFGYSGLMREHIERDEHADILASADMGHPIRLLRDAAPGAAALALLILSIEGQRILARHGFVPVTLPTPEG